MIGILNLEIGNLRSVSNAVYSVGQDFLLIERPEQLDDVSHLIMPGVGAYAPAMANARAKAMLEPVRKYVDSGRPLLGLCVGMQILSSLGEENGRTEGMGLIPGTVRKLPVEGKLPLPHVGWNSLEIRVKHPVLQSIKTGTDFYFVHSFAFECADEAHALAKTEYGAPFTSVVGRANILGFQFHPEKSQTNGLKLIEAFCDWDGQC